jgi:VanZ family protein
MSGQAGSRNFRIIAVILAAVIVYGSLYPFDFFDHAGSPLADLLATWNHRPGRGDFLSNILLYVPLGFFTALAFDRGPLAVRLLLAVVLGSLLSLGVELTQYYDAGRDTELSDLYSNSIGTALGALATLLHPERLFGRGAGLKPGSAVPLLLLAAWAGYKLFPFVPVIDLHKYWHAVRPLLLERQISSLDLVAHFATWTLAAAAINRAAGKNALLGYIGFAGVILVGKIFVIGGSLSLAEVAGAALGLAMLAAAGRRPRLLIAIAAVLLAGDIFYERLAPFDWLAVPRAFGWIPFLGFMQGSINIDVLSFLEKFFLYGGLIWLLTQCGGRLKAVTILVAMLLLAASWAERYLPGRSAELTDAVFALLIGIGFGLLDPQLAKRA